MEKRKIKMYLKFQTWHAMWSSGSSYLPSLTSRNGKMKGQKAFSISNVTCYVKFRAPYLPSFDFRVLQMSCIWKNIHKSSLPQWSIWWEMGNRMIDMDFEFQTWHAMWNSRLHIFLLLTSGSSRWFVFDRLLSYYHHHHDACD